MKSKFFIFQKSNFLFSLQLLLQSLLTMSQNCTIYQCYSRLWQFKCEDCPGKHEHHKYRLWYQKVRGNNPVSQCHSCENMMPAVPRGEEEGVFICFFKCNCEHTFTVKCQMWNTAPCYSCREAEVEPCHFEPRLRIVRKTNAKHSCSMCRGKKECPNLRKRVAYN